MRGACARILFYIKLVSIKMKITVNSITPVFSWHWCVPQDDELCGICRINFDGKCPNCLFPGDQCPVSIGKECHHAFHEHCIKKWLNQDNSRGLCPMCRQSFVEAERKEPEFDVNAVNIHTDHPA